MEQDRWTEVDHYLGNFLSPPDPTLDATLQAMSKAGLPDYQVSPAQGKFLSILAAAIQARSILEIGTLGGYSTIWLARALPADGRLITLEADPKHAAVARANIANAGFGKQVEVRLGLALDSLSEIAREADAPFDLVFIDADKPNTKAYYDWALKLTHPGSLIIIDNVVRNGDLADPRFNDSSIKSMRELMPSLASDPNITASAIQTVGTKGYDGFLIALVTPNGNK
jgi:predicted O-methyltransferase YrrM